MPPRTVFLVCFRFTCQAYDLPSQARQQVLCRKLSDGRCGDGDGGRGASSPTGFGHPSSPAPVPGVAGSAPRTSHLARDWIPSAVCLMALGRQALFQKSKRRTRCHCREVEYSSSVGAILSFRVFAGKQSWLRIAVQMGKWFQQFHAVLGGMSQDLLHYSTALRKL